MTNDALQIFRQENDPQWSSGAEAHGTESDFEKFINQYEIRAFGVHLPLSWYKENSVRLLQFRNIRRSCSCCYSTTDFDHHRRSPGGEAKEEESLMKRSSLVEITCASSAISSSLPCSSRSKNDKSSSAHRTSFNETHRSCPGRAAGNCVRKKANQSFGISSPGVYSFFLDQLGSRCRLRGKNWTIFFILVAALILSGLCPAADAICPRSCACKWKVSQHSLSHRWSCVVARQGRQRQQ